MSGNIADAQEKPDVSSPLPELNLNLHNFDTPEAQNCPYVLTSPRSLEACSRLGVKVRISGSSLLKPSTLCRQPYQVRSIFPPVDLLHKTLAEFQDDLPPGKSLEEIFKLYDEYEQNRTALLAKCQAEREYIIWRSAVKQRSQSLSPGRREKHSLDRSLTSSDDQPFNALRPRNAPLEYDTINDMVPDTLTHQTPSRRRGRPLTRNFSLRSLRPASWSTPTSPFYRGSQTLFLPITSPLLHSKLRNFPGTKMRLPPKKYEHQEEEEDRRAAARRQWDREREYREKQKEILELERWRILAAKCQKNEERFKLKEDILPVNQRMQENISLEGMSNNDFKIEEASNELDKKDHDGKDQIEIEHFSRYDLAQKLRSLQIKEERFEQRRKQYLLKRDEIIKRSAEELNEKIKQVRLNQQDLDKALEKWQNQVTAFQEAANRRAAQKAAENVELRRQKVRQERLSREAEHKKKMQQLEAEKEAKLNEMISKLKDKDERSKAFIQEKVSAIEQARASAHAASDLRELLRQKLDKDSFVKKAQQVFLESRLENLPYKNNDNS
ncbi:coiled-coil domain-containing protein 177-like isoform X2 [Centruroides vittatus]|uniref:coiled-coil domain-containing protein 177-like isoform X2 n=1 Tax=Centruroides vittatus TaxID=120091 RepID=UPI00351032E5